MMHATTKKKTSLLGLALGSLISTSLSAGSVGATTPENTHTPKKGFFSIAKEKASQAKTNVADAASAARRAGCTNTLFSATNFRPALNNCVTNYPEDMKKLLRDLKNKKDEKLKEIRSINTEIEKSLASNDLPAMRAQPRELQKDLRKEHEKQVKSSQVLYKRKDSLSAERTKLKKQITAIEGAAHDAIADLEQKLKNPKYSASHQSLEAKKTKIEQMFLEDASEETEGEQ